jgi:pimeloyl-ACP methyl ester carboxylesterase
MQEYLWTWEKQKLRVSYENFGQGSPILLLPALSTVSSSSEMDGIAQKLAAHFQVTVVDWPGFGKSERLPLDYRPALYCQFLQDFVKDIFGSSPITVIAAGHGASYAIELASENPSLWSRLVLVAPTWRGPLPTAMGEHRGWYKLLRNLVRSPFVGQFLYSLTIKPSFLRLMYRRHVYSNPDKVTDEFVKFKRQNSQKQGARYAAAAFVTGELDAVLNREGFLAWFQSLSVPLMVVIGEQTPPKSKAEMEAIGTLSGVHLYRMDGSLGIHEEYGDHVATAILPFLQTSS